TNTPLKATQIREIDSVKLKFAMKKAAATIPTPSESKTLLVNKTMAIANICGNNDQIVFSIHKPPRYLSLPTFYILLYGTLPSFILFLSTPFSKMRKTGLYILFTFLL